MARRAPSSGNGVSKSRSRACDASAMDSAADGPLATGIERDVRSELGTTFSAIIAPPGAATVAYGSPVTIRPKLWRGGVPLSVKRSRTGTPPRLLLLPSGVTVHSTYVEYGAPIDWG